MNILKHVGKHNDKKVVILYRKVPDQDHMCLVVYSETLARIYHDTLMQALESPVGQEAKDFADALYRTLLPDGRNSLQVLHKEGKIKKVPTNQVLVTPTAKSSVRLDELNKILDKMADGAEAVAALKELETKTTTKNKKNQTYTEEEFQQALTEQKSKHLAERTTSASVTGEDDSYAPALNIAHVLTNQEISDNLLQQSITLETNANSLLAEAARLRLEAESYVTTAKAKKAINTTKVVAKAKKASASKGKLKA